MAVAEAVWVVFDGRFGYFDALVSLFLLQAEGLHIGGVLLGFAFCDSNGIVNTKPRVFLRLASGRVASNPEGRSGIPASTFTSRPSAVPG